MVEKGLFILWEKARSKEKEIMSDIALHFDVLETFTIDLGNKFLEIIEDFYDHNIPPNENKAEKCGDGEFLVVVVRDNNAAYDYRETLRAKKIVEVNFFDAKKRYRKMANPLDPYCIVVHGTNSKQEFEHDYVYLNKLRGNHHA